MEDNTNNKSEFKDRLIYFYQNNKVKLYIFLFITILFSISITSFKIYSEKKNQLIAEKYIQAGIFLGDEKNEKSKLIYEEIILSGNKFYSILSLNTILEKNLVKDEKKVLKYFDLIEKANKSNANLELILFKKALYLIKIGKSEEGNTLLKQFSKNQKSKYKALAEEIISK